MGIDQRPLTKVNPRTSKVGGGGGGGNATPLKVFLKFFLDDKTTVPHVFLSSCSFIPRAHFETSSVMVSCHDYEILRHK